MLAPGMTSQESGQERAVGMAVRGTQAQMRPPLWPSSGLVLSQPLPPCFHKAMFALWKLHLFQVT